MTRGIALFFGIVLAGVFVDAAGPTVSLPSASAQLKTISTRVQRDNTQLVVEATEPVPFVTQRPDPYTVLLDFRNVGAQGLANRVAPAPGGPIADVTVESAESMGDPVSRVRVQLTQPLEHHVRSQRNSVVVEFAGLLAGQALTPQVPLDAMQALERPTAFHPSQGGGASRAPDGGYVPLLAVPQLQAQGPGQGAQTPQGGQSGQAAGGERRYTGNPVTLDFQGADLRAVLRTFSEISGLNIVIDPAIQGSVDVALRDVPWDQALDMILRSNKLGYVVDGTIVRVAPLNVLADEETQRRKLSDEQALAGQLRVLTKTLSYAKAEELQALLTKSALSQRGTVQVDPRTNTLIISDLQDRLSTATDLISTLDRPQPQVEIEARIVQTTKDFARALGVQWGLTGKVDPTLGNTTPLAFPNKGSIGGKVGGEMVNLPVGAANSGVGLVLGSVNGAFNLDVALSALEKNGNGRILSTPRVSTQNNIEAEITQGVQIPIQTVANNTVTVTFKDAALTLKVTPQITAADTVIMRIAVENASPDFSRAVGPSQIPPINTQRANTTVLVNDTQTTVIGGIYTSQEQSQSDRTPGLSRVPFLNWLFKRENVTDQSTELLIFITPRIIKA